MTSTNLNIQTAINTLYRDYANYTISNRAIPCYVDGLKPVQRKVLYNMLTNYGYGKKVKVVDSSSISSIGYKHGETSAQSATILMTAEYNNNYPLFIGHGAFGTRQVPEPSAPRYIYIELSKNTYNIFADNDTLVYDEQDKTNLEPLYYLPVIPLLLLNGSKGIAVGFSTNILSYSVKDIKEIMQCYYTGYLPKAYKLIDELLPTFPDFRGDVIRDEENPNKYYITGIVEKIPTKRNNSKLTEYVITELPYSYSRESYYEILQKLIDTNKIVDFVDECTDTFKFKIVVNSTDCDKIDKEPLIYFKIKTSMVENLTVIDENGKLREYTNKKDLLDDWVSFRVEQSKKQIELDISKLNKSLSELKLKLDFINAIINGDIDIKTSKYDELLSFVDGLNPNIEISVKKNIISSPIHSLTKDEIAKLQKRIDDVMNNIDELKNTNEFKRLCKLLENVNILE